jgi:lipooligosaccharide transport system permease protein
VAPAMMRVVEREVFVLRRLWHGIAFSAFVQPALYLVAMGVGLGSYVDDGARGGSTTAIAGFTYLEFVTPGLLAATAFQLAVGESLWYVMSGAKWDKRYHAMLAGPVGSTDIMLSHVAWNAIRSVMSAVPFLAIAAVVGGVRSWTAVLAIPAVALLAVSVSALVATWSTTTDDEQTFPLVMRFGVLPLFLFSGTFFPISSLPRWLQLLAPISPLYHGVELCRAATTGTGEPLAVAVHLGVLLAIAAAGLLLARRSFARRLSA